MARKSIFRKVGIFLSWKANVGWSLGHSVGGIMERQEFHQRNPRMRWKPGNKVILPYNSKSGQPLTA